jgi:hypothetical protein
LQGHPSRFPPTSLRNGREIDIERSQILGSAYACRMPTDPVHRSRRHANPLRYALKNRRDASWVQATTQLRLTDQAPKNRAIVNFGMLQPNLKPSHRLARKVRHPSLPFGIGLPAPNQHLAGAVRMQIQVSDFERHQLAPPGERFIGHAEKSTFPIGSETLASALDKFLDVLPAERMRLILSR